MDKSALTILVHSQNLNSFAAANGAVFRLFKKALSTTLGCAMVVDYATVRGSPK